MISIMLIGFIIVSIFLTLLWLWQKRSGNAAIADAGWTGSMALLTFWYASWSGLYTLRTAVIAGLAMFWALRLTHHIIFYRVRGRPEDGRYAAMRAYWNEKAQSRFLLFFQGQAIAAFLFTLPILVAIHAPRTGWTGWDWLAVLTWLIAVSGESIADHQLEKFRSQPENKGKTCRDGLWRYSRHPNYFFEWIHWFTYVAFSVGHPLWLTTWLAPALMLLFLFKFTGIPYTELQALKSRGDDYRAYQRTTNVFIPWFPKVEKEKSA